MQQYYEYNIPCAHKYPHLELADGNKYHVKVNPQEVYIFRDCYADMECLEYIGKKANDIGCYKTLFYKGKYNVYLRDGDPDTCTRKSADGVWIIVSKETFYRHTPKNPWW